MMYEISTPIKPVIKIHYGPYEVNGLLKHRKEKISGLIAYLQKLDFVVEIIRVANLNLLSIDMLGVNVYCGSLEYINFNSECEDDKVCQKIICDLREALYRMYHPVSSPDQANSMKQCSSHMAYTTVNLSKPKMEVNFFRNNCL